MKPATYDFEKINPTDYKLQLNIEIEGRLMNYVFNKAKNRINKEIKGKPDDVPNFNIPKQYIKVISTALTSQLKEVNNIVKKEGIEVMSQELIKAWFEKTKGNWQVYAIFEGKHHDKLEVDQ